MSTCSGDLGPGLLWYLFRTEGLDDKQFNEMVNFQSGRLSISGWEFRCRKGHNP